MGLAGMGIIIRDESRMIIAAFSQKIPLLSSMDMVEALVARRALIFAQEISIFNVEVEDDSLKVIQAVNNPKPNRTQLGHIINDHIQRIGAGMQTCSFFHTRRGAIGWPTPLQSKQFLLLILMCG